MTNHQSQPRRGPLNVQIGKAGADGVYRRRDRAEALRFLAELNGAAEEAIPAFARDAIEWLERERKEAANR